MAPDMCAAYSGETSGQDAVQHGPGDTVNVVGQGTSSGSYGGQQGPGTASDRDRRDPANSMDNGRLSDVAGSQRASGESR